MSFWDFDRYVFNRMNSMLRDFDDFNTANDTPLLTSGTQTGSQTVAQRPTRSMLGARMDLVEKPDAYELNVELPGIKKEDIQLNVENGHLHIAAERREETRKEGEHYHFSERRYGSIKRTVPLPEQANEQAVKAEFADGVLKLHFGKKAESNNRKTITIN